MCQNLWMLSAVPSGLEVKVARSTPFKIVWGDVNEVCTYIHMQRISVSRHWVWGVLNYIMIILTRTTPLSPEERTRDPNHCPDFLSYCWPVGARVFPERWQKILKILSISLQCFILNDTTLPLVSNGMRSQFLADSGGHLKTAPPFTTSGWPESAVGAPTKSLQWRRTRWKISSVNLHLHSHRVN